MATPAADEMVRIETGTSNDIDAVMEVMDSAFGDRFGEAWTRSQLAGILPMAGVCLVVAWGESGRHAKGFSLFRTAVDESELLLIAVAPPYQGRGIGRLLLDDFLGRARADGAGRVHLEVRDGNPAVEIYRTAGFAPIGRRRHYYRASNGKRFDAITLAFDF